MELEKILFDGWEGLIRILISAPVIYVSVIAFIRVAGKRSTSQMNNFDWIVTVALGSIVGSGVVLDDVSVSDALFAVALLLAAQVLVTKGIRHHDWLGKLVKAEPRLLVHDGGWLEGAMSQERIARAEVLAAIREKGLTGIGEVQWVILETDASFSVVPKGDKDFSGVDLEDVSGVPS